MGMTKIEMISGLTIEKKWMMPWCTMMQLKFDIDWQSGENLQVCDVKTLDYIPILEDDDLPIQRGSDTYCKKSLVGWPYTTM